jgi:hypothetical protein
MRRPAAYIRTNPNWGLVARAAAQHALTELTRSHGWPEPELYLDEDTDEFAADGKTALAALTAAIGAGRHDSVLLAGPGVIYGCPSHLLRRLLASCSRHGVSVDCLMI